MTATLATLPLEIILSISAFLSNPLDVLSLSHVCRATHIFTLQHVLTPLCTLRPATPRSSHLGLGHHTGPNQSQQHTCRVQHHGIATHRVNSVMLIFDMQPPTVGGSPRHQLLKLHSDCHPHQAQKTPWTFPNTGARFGGHTGHGLFGARRKRSASTISGLALS